LVTPPPTVSKDALIAGKYKIIEEIGRGGMGGAVVERRPGAAHLDRQLLHLLVRQYSLGGSRDIPVEKAPPPPSQ
jgi:hypothetical protein